MKYRSKYGKVQVRLINWGLSGKLWTVWRIGNETSSLRFTTWDEAMGAANTKARVHGLAEGKVLFQ